jgi:hypothetical protein
VHHDGGLEPTGDLDHRRILESADVVEDGRARGGGVLGDFGLGRIDRQRDLASHRFEHGSHPVPLLEGLHRRGAGARRLAADVEPIGALFDQPARVRDRIVLCRRRRTSRAWR